MTDNFEKDINVPSKEIYIDGVDVNALYSDQIACMNRYEVANLFIKTVEQLKAKEQECEELKKEKRNFYNFLTNKYNYGSFRPMWGAYLLKHFFKKDLGDFFDEKAYEMADTIEEKEQQLDQLNTELEEYKNVVNKLSGMQVILTNEEKMPMLYENAKDLKLKQFSKTLIGIKEIAKYELNNLTESAINGGRYVEILQKINEVVLNE